MSRRRVLGGVVMAVCILPYAFPVYWMVITSFKSIQDIYADRQQWFPAQPTLDAYAAVADASMFIAIRNSMIVATGVALGTVLISVPSAFALSRFRLRGGSTILFGTLVLQIVPPALMVIPMFLLMNSLGLVNNRLGAILAVMTLTVPFAVVMLRPMFQSFPVALEEAARIDGAGTFSVLWRVVTPVLSPGIATIAGLSFMFAWGEFVYSLTLMQSQDLWPITVLVSQQITEVGVAWDRLMAVSILTSLPVVVAYLLLQRHIREGVAAGAVKG